MIIRDFGQKSLGVKAFIKGEHEQNPRGTWEKLPVNMTSGDFTRLKAFMRAIDLCLNKNEKDRETAFKGGKLKRTKKLKKYK